MTNVSAPLKVAVIAASASVVLVFAEVTLSVLIPIMVGVALMMMGVAIAYRPPAVVGMLTVITMAAVAIDVSTLTDAGSVFAATISIYLPSLFMAWASLSSEPGDTYELRLRTWPFARLVATAVVCIMSVPLFVFLLGIVLPGVSMRVSTMAEMSILLLAASAAALMFARSSPTLKPEGVEEPVAAE